ncbi:uncharacterized protein MAL13P1.304 [Tribolium madens]|uniref:uncharacterized protein MAL13P1.304 n=1 Tax=Tribolium madens TaxID=41895 RepID=UPI001CF74506|nr:uncharacterized protein MAL13P1.304 [Tribolium madens]
MAKTMSQARNNYQNNNPKNHYQNNNANNVYGLNRRHCLTKEQKKRIRCQKPYDRFHFYRGFNRYPPPHWNNAHRRGAFVPRPNPRQTPREENSRSPSPFSGTEEYTQKKIQETSDMIKKQLMMPPEAEEIVNVEQNKELPPQDTTECKATENDKNFSKNESEKSVAKSKKVTHYNVEEIHNKIITHISNLNHGKKMNLICSTSSGYDIAIQQIQKQKRLELSKVLRDMCTSQAVESSEVINAIIPDIGIKIEDLPLEVIQELSSTLDLNFDDSSFLENSCDTINVRTDVCENGTQQTEREQNIKEEINCVENESVFSLQQAQNENEVIKIKQEYNSDEIIENSEEINCVGSEFVFSLQHAQNENEVIKIKKEYNADEIIENSVVDKANFFEVVNEIQYGYISQTNDSEFSETKSQTVFTKRLVSSESQTDFVEFHSSASQTDNNLSISKEFEVRENIENLKDAVKVMFKIDKEIERLTKLRQTIFTKLQGKSNHKKSSVNQLKNIVNKRKFKKITREGTTKCKRKLNLQDKSAAQIMNETIDFIYKEPLKFEIFSEKILVLKLIEEVLLAASESGKIFYINIHTGTTEATLQVSHTPITCLCYLETPSKQSHLFVGSFESYLREYHCNTRLLVNITNITDCIQCMEHAWEYIFIGTTNGRLKRYSLKRKLIEFEDTISEEAVLVLKATQEGARRVLLVGSRNAQVCVKDAMSGLYLRTLGEWAGCVTPTVYSLLLENSLVYCGTMSHDILVFGFHNGNLVHRHQATNSKGICCMKIVKNLLFASCYNGNIYVYNVVSDNYVGMIEGAGGVILSMEVFKNLVIVGTMSHNFRSLLIPDYILENWEA